MTDQQIRIAVAKIAGWSNIYKSYLTEDAIVWYGRPPAAKRVSKLFPDPRAFLPDYLNDANAVIPLLEKWEFQVDFAKNYRVTIICIITWEQYFAEAPTFARAACEALLKAYGKWTE